MYSVRLSHPPRNICQGCSGSHCSSLINGFKLGLKKSWLASSRKDEVQPISLLRIARPRPALLALLWREHCTAAVLPHSERGWHWVPLGPLVLLPPTTHFQLRQAMPCLMMPPSWLLAFLEESMLRTFHSFWLSVTTFELFFLLSE